MNKQLKQNIATATREAGKMGYVVVSTRFANCTHIMLKLAKNGGRNICVTVSGKSRIDNYIRRDIRNADTRYNNAA